MLPAHAAAATPDGRPLLTVRPRSTHDELLLLLSGSLGERTGK
jgi:hypothetical protein